MDDNDIKGRRYSDEMLWRLDQKLEDHLKWAEGEDQVFKERLIALESFRNSIEKPVHAAGWIIIGLVGSFIAAVGAYLWKMLSRISFTG